MVRAKVRGRYGSKGMNISMGRVRVRVRGMVGVGLGLE